MILESETYEYVLTLNDIINRERLAGIKAIDSEIKTEESRKIDKKRPGTSRSRNLHEIFQDGVDFWLSSGISKEVLLFVYLFIKNDEDFCKRGRKK